MSIDPRTTYLDKRAVLVDAFAPMEHIRSQIQEIAEAFENGWDQILLADEDRLLTPPAHRGRGPKKLLATEWPTFESFAVALKAWRRAWKDAEDALRRIPEAGQKGVERLPERPSEKPSRRH